MQSSSEIQPHHSVKRGDATRYALIQAGLELFGENGFNATTTRMLCDKAGANISAIPYYFDSKKGLYLAVMEYIVERMQGHFGQVHSALADMNQSGPIPRDQAIEVMRRVIRSIAQFFVESEEPKAWVQLIMREQASPTEAFDIIYEGQMKHVQRVFATLIAACTGLPLESDDVKLRSHALVGQILIFIVSRESLLRHLKVSKLSADHIEKIYSILLLHAEACLTSTISNQDSHNEQSG